MTDRDRLIELIQKEVPRPKADALAYHLLANGVVLLDFAVVTPENRPLITQIANMPLNEVCELIKAKQEGRTITPPCKVGDKVYRIANDSKTITEERVGEIHLEFTIDDGTGWHNVWWLKEYNIGVTTFLTKEEAEAKLKEREC